MSLMRRFVSILALVAFLLPSLYAQNPNRQPIHRHSRNKSRNVPTLEPTSTARAKQSNALRTARQRRKARPHNVAMEATASARAVVVHAPITAA
jgi:hypothetical protein